MSGIVTGDFMSLLRKVAHNTALQLVGKIVGTILGFGATVLLLRYLGDEKYGNFTTAMVYLQLFGILMDLGLYIVLLKHIASEAKHSIVVVNNIITLRLVTAVVFLIVACSVVWLIPEYPLIVKWSVMVVAANFFFITMNQLFMGIYQKYLAMGWVALAEVVGKVVLFVSTLVVIYVLHGDLLSIMVTVVLGGGINFLMLWFGLRKYTRISLAFNLNIWKKLLQESWPVALSIGLNLIYFKADTIFLAKFYPQYVVGIYGAPYKMLEVMITLPAMIVGLVMPMLSRFYEAKQSTEFKDLYQKAINGLAMIAIPMVVGTQFIAHPLMTLAAGEKFTDNIADLGNLLQILIIAVGMIFIGTLTGYLVVVVNKQRQMIWGYAFVAFTALAGYLYFIPKYSYYGAASVTVYSETMILLIGLWIVYRASGFLPSFSIIARITLASAVMGGILYLLQDLHFVWLIIIACIVYVPLLFIMRGISKAEIKSLMTLRSNV